MNLFIPDNLPDDFFDNKAPGVTSDIEVELDQLKNNLRNDEELLTQLSATVNEIKNEQDKRTASVYTD